MKLLHSILWPVFFTTISLAYYLIDGLKAVFIYDRSAILAGDIWRLVTGHFVHFSPTHLFYDLTAMIVTTWFIAYRGYPYLILLEIVSGLSISLMILIFLPSMAFYGGLSGIVMANAVYLALSGFKDKAPWSSISPGILLLCLIKLILDFSGIASLAIQDNNFIPVPLSHLTGALTGLSIFLYASHSPRFSVFKHKK